MKKYLITLLILCIITSQHILAQTKEQTAIAQVLTLQTESWNKGDINGFMQSYWKSDSLMFIGKSGITYGWQNTLDNYKKGYPDTNHMGKLKFEILKINKISVDNYFVVGNWFLTRSVGDINGIFSLWFKKVNNQWVIVADHSS